MPSQEDALFGVSLRSLPANLQAEQALLGALLANNRAFERVQDFLAPEHFADPIHGRIFETIARRILAGQMADAVTLKAEYEHTGVLEEVGGTKYLAQLITAMVGILNTGEYGKTILDTWQRRQLIDIGETIVNMAFGAEPLADATEQIATAMSSLLALSERGLAQETVSFSDSVGSALRRSEAAFRGADGHTRLDTGIGPLDEILQGLWPGQLYFLAARSRTGKTPALMQIARNVARTFLADAERTGAQPASVLIFSMEMTADDIANISRAATSRWSVDQIRAGQIGDGNAWNEMNQTAAALQRLPIIIDDRTDLDLDRIGVRARSAVRRHNVRMIGVDYMELIKRTKEQRGIGLPELIPALGYGLKAIAKQTGVPVIALRQINKARDDQASSRPVLGDLPYDGGQAADVVAALFREELTMGRDRPNTGNLTAEKAATIIAAFNKRLADAKGVADVGVIKRRFGPAPVWRRMAFNGPRMLLEEIERPENDDNADLWRDGI